MTGKLIAVQADKTIPGSSDDEKKEVMTEGRKGWAGLFRYRPQKMKNLEHHAKSRPLFYRRTVICASAFLAFIILYIMRNNMSVAIVKMTKPYMVVEGDHVASKLDYDWNLKEQGIILSSFFFGYLLTQVPGGYLAVKWGGRKTFGLGFFLASLVTFFTPIFGQLGFYGFVVARILCGLFEGVTYPAIHAMWNYWAPPHERTTLVTSAFSGAYLGASFSMLQFSPREEILPWYYMFYVSGTFGLTVSSAWLFCGAEYPQDDPWITEEELRCLTETIGHQTNKPVVQVPWLKILLSPRVWAINVCHFAANWGFYTMLTELPTYLTKAWHFQENEVATAACYPFLAMFASALLGGFFIDKVVLRYLGTTNTRKATVCLSFLAQMMFYFLAGKATENVLSYILGALFFCGLSWAGFSANHLDIAPDYASVLLGISNTIGTIPGIVTPLLTAYLVENENDPESWSPVFLIAGYIYMAAAVFYVIFGSGECQDWADPNESQRLNSCMKQGTAADVEAGGGAKGEGE